ncbi:MAG TPA: alpha/beta hydrolase [Candidatus Polarisedimenticolaceae bacterium]|nr:alpha/beta hydrolase [Candidatus Polarisedimenticolaceae bacterium]
MRRSAWVVPLLVIAACGPRPDEAPGQTAGTASAHGVVESFDGVPVAYSSYGTGEGTLVFVHGLSCDRGYWDAQTEAFDDVYHVVTVDLGGHGESGDDRAEWTIRSLARDVEAVIERLDLGPVVIVGHALGGWVALDVARSIPERVVGVIVVEALQSVSADRPADPIGQPARWQEDFGGYCRELAGTMFHDGADPALRERITADLCGAPPDIATALVRAITDHDAAAALAATPVPVRALNGDLSPTDVEGNRRHHPDFDATVIEGTGHFPMLERPADFNRMLERIIEELTAGATT